MKHIYRIQYKERYINKSLGLNPSIKDFFNKPYEINNLSRNEKFIYNKFIKIKKIIKKYNEIFNLIELKFFDFEKYFYTEVRNVVEGIQYKINTEGMRPQYKGNTIKLTDI